MLRHACLAAVLALGLAAVPTATAATHHCSRLVDIGPTGMDPADGVSIVAKGVSCRTAHAVVKGDVQDVTGKHKTHSGFRCDDRFSGTVTCRRGTARVTFRLG